MPKRIAAWVLTAALVAMGSACGDRGLTPVSEGSDGPDDPGDQPEGETAAYSACLSADACDPLEFCVFPSGEDGFCSVACNGPDDNAPCGVLPDGESEATCLDIGLPDARRVCAIACEGGAQCPRGMRCEAVESAGEERRICF